MTVVSSASGEDVQRRQTAYADLVAAVLDLHPTTAAQSFDRAVADAVASGALPETLARELRWLQRQSVRAVVEHAAQVLPATLVALERDDAVIGPSRPEASSEPSIETSIDPPAPPPTPGPPVDLTSRRMLVAGLRPLGDPPFP